MKDDYEQYSVLIKSITHFDNLKMNFQTSKTFVSLGKAQELGVKYKLPLYLYSEEILLNKVSVLLKSAQDFHISYAMKANSNSKILQILRASGIRNVDVVSTGEIRKALINGYSPEEILYTENFIDDEQMEYALSQNVMINIGALDTLKYFKEKLSGREIFIRINPNKGAGQNYKVITGGPESKFGISENQIDQVLKVSVEKNIKIVGLHQHIGSNLKLQDHHVFTETTKFIFEKSRIFPHCRYVNIGGGIGVKYKADEQLLDMEGLYSEIREIKNQINPNIQIWVEPGRFLLAECGILLCKITARKQTTTRVFYGTNTGFNHLLRPSFYNSHHAIFNINDKPDQKKELATICGNICESSDNLGNDIQICGEIGDILCIENVGAYGFCMSSNYNERLRPAEVMIKQNGEDVLIRRRETYEDLEDKL